jgi:hypothetical protein
MAAVSSLAPWGSYRIVSEYPYPQMVYDHRMYPAPYWNMGMGNMIPFKVVVVPQEHYPILQTPTPSKVLFLFWIDLIQGNAIWIEPVSSSGWCYDLSRRSNKNGGRSTCVLPNRSSYKANLKLCKKKRREKILLQCLLKGVQLLKQLEAPPKYPYWIQTVFVLLLWYNIQQQ